MLLVETYLDKSPNKGFGLFAKNLIPKDTIIWKFMVGFDIEIHTSEYESLSDVQKQVIDTYFWREGDYLYTSCDNSVFQNHGKDPNSIVYGELMRAARDILPNEEILVDYSTFDDDFDSYKDTLI